MKTETQKRLLHLNQSSHTDFLHGSGRGQESLLQQLLPGLLVLHLDLRHHVTRHKAHVAGRLPAVEAVWVLISINLRKGRARIQLLS